MEEISSNSELPKKLCNGLNISTVAILSVEIQIQYICLKYI